MDIIAGLSLTGLLLAGLIVLLFEYRIRRPDVIVLRESKGQIGIRKGLLYPRHFSLPLKRTTTPVQLTVEATTLGNLAVRVKLIGSAAPSAEHIQSLIRVGGWDVETVARAVDQVRIELQALVKEYTERSEIHSISSPALQKHLNGSLPALEERFGIELIALAVQSMDPADPKIAEALRQQEAARLLEETERVNQDARVKAARARFAADQEIAELEHTLNLKRADLQKAQFESDAELARRRIEDEQAASRMRLAFENEELDVLRRSPELLMLTPQAARLAEASQGLKNARTVITLTPQDLAAGSTLFDMFRNLVQKAQGSNEDS